MPPKDPVSLEALKLLGTQPIPKKSALIKTDKPRPHICTICTRAFARLEHLKRHERSHTNEKPFQCAACGRCFARRDLVLRHQQKLHTSLPTINRRSKNIIPGNDKANSYQKDINEHINILHNNTNPNAPLPKNYNPPQIDEFNPILNTTNKSNNKQNPQPPSKANPHPTSLFNHIQQLTPQSITSPDSNKVNSSNRPNQPTIIHNSNYTFGASHIAHTQTAQATHEHHSSTHQHHMQHQIPHHQHSQQPQHHRHASFSASSTTSYTNNKDASQIYEKNNIPDAPHQVGFATPQLSAVELAERAAMSGMDLDALGIDWVDLDKLDFEFLDEDEHESELNAQSLEQHHNHGSTHNSSHNHFSNVQGDMEGNHYFDSSHHVNHLKSNPFEFNITPGGTLIDIPILQQFLLVGSGGGGAGFDNSRNFSFKNIPQNIEKRLMKHEDEQKDQIMGDDFTSTTKRSKVKDPEEVKKEGEEDKEEEQEQKPVQMRGQKRVQSPQNNDWLQEFINTPHEMEFPIASHHIGFTDSPTSSVQTNPGSAGQSNTNQNSPNGLPGDDIPSLFRSRQIDLFKQIHNNSNNSLLNSQAGLIGGGPNLSNANYNNELHPSDSFKTGDNNNSGDSSKVKDMSESERQKRKEEENYTPIFTESLRENILSTNNLSNLQFPPLNDLNSYWRLYETEFDQFFPFVHLSSLKNLNFESKIDNIPLLLSICSIGALYSFHSKNSTLLFNISRYQIHYFMESHQEIFNFNNVPLWVPQSLVLHMFLGMFNNSSDNSNSNSTSRQMNSLAGLIKSSSFNLPLEQFLLPPPTIDQNNNRPEALQNSYDYFVLAQSRIRTVHTLYMISVLRSSLIGSKNCLDPREIECGTPCYLEELWKSPDASDWFEKLKKNHLTIDSKFSLIEISNGEPMINILNDLDQHYCDKKLSLKTLLTLLMSIKDRIYIERMNSNNEGNGEIKAAKWRLNSRPLLESLLKSWELFFIRNGGFLITNESNLNLIKRNPIFKIILPFISLSKIRLCVDLTPIIEKIWSKDWVGMNEALKLLDSDPEALRESTGYSYDIIKLWVEHISIINNAEKTSVRTPIFFVTCIFTAILIIADYLYTTEIWAEKYATNKTSINAVDRVLWLRLETLLKKVEKNLLPKGSNNSSYSEFLRMQANGALDVERIDDELAQLALNSGIELKHTAEIISKARLSSRALSLGVRILADAPVWPVAMGFAEALKARAIYISKLKSSGSSI